MLNRYRLLLCILTVAVSGCGTFSGGGELHEPAELQPIKDRIQVQQVWDRSSGKGTDAQYLKLEPLVTGTAIVTVDFRGTLKAFDLEKGKRQWEHTLEGGVTAGVAGGGDTVLVGTREGDVIATSTQEGAERWRTRLSSEVMAISGISRLGTVAVRTNDSKLYALDATNGQELWHSDQNAPPLTLRGMSDPIVEEDIAVAGFDAGKLTAFSLPSGDELWQTTIAVGSGRSELARLVDIDGRLQVDSGVIYVASYQGHVAAVTLQAGRVIWSRELSSYQGLAVDDSYVYLTDDQGNVRALDKRNGSSVWKQDKLLYRGLTAPAVVDGYVIVGDYEGYIHWLDPADGRRVARKRFDGSAVLATPAVAGQRAYALSQGGELAALELVKPASSKQ